MPLKLKETNISDKNNKLKILNDRRKTSWLFTSTSGLS